MNIRDWSAPLVELEPTSRRLYEALNRKEWEAAEKAAEELHDIVGELMRLCIYNRVVSGTGKM